ncbi:MAG: glucuronate isomerase [Verrucomicrobiota bacterium]
MTISARQKQLSAQVEKIVESTPITDIHTHLYDPAFGKLLLWGIDDLLVYHYLVAESFRYLDLPYQDFFNLSKTDQASLIWDALFIQHSPISEACRGVLTTLNALGLDVKKRDLRSLRKWFGAQKPEQHITRCLQLANVESVCMTNSPFDDLERPVWENGFSRDARFMAALRIDPLLLSWKETASQLAVWGYEVTAALNQKTISEVRRFLTDWSKKIQARYLMVSLPPDFAFPANTDCNTLIEKAVLPHCRDFNLPFALMPGVRRAVNPQLNLAGDGLGLSNLLSLSNLCAGFPDNKFMATVLARENQHELCVLARKFRNLHIFGCWWFLNVPGFIEEMTRMRLELVGLSMTPQHSDARVLDQLIYKWRHSKKVIARVLAEKYGDLVETGWNISKAEMERDVRDLFGGAFEKFCDR